MSKIKLVVSRSLCNPLGMPSASRIAVSSAQIVAASLMDNVQVLDQIIGRHYLASGYVVHYGKADKKPVYFAGICFTTATIDNGSSSKVDVFADGEHLTSY